MNAQGIVSKLKDIVVICNGCGEPMNHLGCWPFQYPKADKPMNIQEGLRFMCKTCRTPHAEAALGVPVGFSIIETEFEDPV